ncbi:MAG: phosphatase PAP2 family protein [Burkholderiaceae bacterium]
MTTTSGAGSTIEVRQGHLSFVRTLGVGVAAVLLVLAFALLAGEMLEGDTRAFDMVLLRAAQSLRADHPWVSDVMRDFSGLGSTVVLTLFTAITVGYLALASTRTIALLVAASAISGSICVSVFKAAFGRARPDTVYAELVATGLSFPSGHATMSAVVFLTLGALVASTRMLWIERIYIVCATALMTVLVGASRIVLGVHWATDVLGGWAFGSAWAIAWLLLASLIDRRRRADRFAAMSRPTRPSQSD